MRVYGINPTEGIEVPPDTTITLILAANTAQAIDYQDNTHIMRLTGMSTANAQLCFYSNLNSTGAVVPSSGATTASSAINQPVIGTRVFQIPNDSTGYSLVAQTSGYVVAECWRK